MLIPPVGNSRSWVFPNCRLQVGVSLYIWRSYTPKWKRRHVIISCSICKRRPIYLRSGSLCPRLKKKVAFGLAPVNRLNIWPLSSLYDVLSLNGRNVTHMSFIVQKKISDFCILKPPEAKLIIFHRPQASLEFSLIMTGYTLNETP